MSLCHEFFELGQRHYGIVCFDDLLVTVPLQAADTPYRTARVYAVDGQKLSLNFVESWDELGDALCRIDGLLWVPLRAVIWPAKLLHHVKAIGLS